MQKAMSLEALLNEVQRQTEVKRDYVANTESQARVALEGSTLFMEILKPGSQLLERLSISENAHRQIASRLNIPWKFYERLLNDHPDLVQQNVNELFRREPETRMFRALDGEVRAFLSDRYLRLDNEEVLCNTLPSIVKGEHPTTLLSSNVTPNSMNLKVLFTGDELAHEVTKANGTPRIIRPGFRLSNSETGAGAFKIEAFFYDSYCTNGCVFGVCNLFNFKRTHIGGRVAGDSNLQLTSQRTQSIENQLILSQVDDAMSTLANPENVRTMAEALKTAANTPKVRNPIAAVELLATNLQLREKEKNSMLETFLRDQDYTQFGLSSALTEVANNESVASYARACEIEEFGGSVLSLNQSAWRRYVEAEPAQAA